MTNSSPHVLQILFIMSPVVAHGEGGSP